MRGVLNDAISIYFADARLPAPLWPDGAPGPRSSQPAACSRRVMMSWQSLGNPLDIGRVGARRVSCRTDKIKCRGTQGRLRPHACIVDMDLNDIDAAFLYLSIDLF
jgi:hypothetical protein